MKPFAVRGVLPWLAMVGLFAAAAVYVLAVHPGGDAARPGAAVRPGAAGAPVPVSVSHGDGLSDSHDGYRLSPVTLPTGRGRAIPVAFRILGPDGAPATAYEPVQTRPLHLYVVREDLSAYQHLHPQLTGDTWTATVDVPDGGAYRIYAEFTPAGRAGSGHPTVLGVPFVITGDTTYVPPPLPVPAVRAGGFTVKRLDGTTRLKAGRPDVLRFQVLDAAGTPVASLEPYLGVFAHVSAFEVLTGGLTHLHPVTSADPKQAPADGVLTFHAKFPNLGEQRLFLQFQVAGKVHQAAFTVAVT
jgi:hypothetical protein